MSAPDDLQTDAPAEGGSDPITPGIESAWVLYGPHRARLTNLLLESAPDRDGTLALLGAGRCRDVDLVQAGRKFAALNLVDISPDALAAARARQPLAVRPRLRLHGGVELGLGDHLPAWQKATPDEARLAGQLEGLLASVPAAIAQRLPVCDVVASTCLLSQLSWQVSTVLGTQNATAERVRAVLVAIHLRTLVTLTAPGGTALLASDLVSADRGALESRLLARGPRQLVDDLVAGGHNFRGTSPPYIERLLREDPFIAPQIERVEVLEPWLWTRTADRTYLIYGVRFRRRRLQPTACR